MRGGRLIGVSWHVRVASREYALCSGGHSSFDTRLVLSVSEEGQRCRTRARFAVQGVSQRLPPSAASPPINRTMWPLKQRGSQQMSRSERRSSSRWSQGGRRRKAAGGRKFCIDRPGLAGDSRRQRPRDEALRDPDE